MNQTSVGQPSQAEKPIVDWGTTSIVVNGQTIVVTFPDEDKVIDDDWQA